MTANFKPQIDPTTTTPGLRTLGAGSHQAAPGDDARFATIGSGSSGTIKVSYLGTPGLVGTLSYSSYDLAGNQLTAPTTAGILESPVEAGLYTYNESQSLDQFVTQWDEGDGSEPGTEVISQRHVATLPGAPTSVTAVAGDQRATISFALGDDGGSAILSCVATSNHGQTQTGARSPLVVTGLTNGTSYTFTVHATNIVGNSPESSASNSVMPVAAPVRPQPPTGVAAVAGNAQATISFTAPANNGGSAITGYTVTAIDTTTTGHGGQTQSGASSPRTITGLTNGDDYHFTVHATNAIGNSVESAASNTITPLGSGTAVAFFKLDVSTPYGPGTIINLDATGSNGTLRWTVNGTNALTTATKPSFGPLPVGNNTIQLTATASGTATTTQVIDVPWIARPLAQAQHDSCNAGAAAVAKGTWGTPAIPDPTKPANWIGSHSFGELPKWSSGLATISAWRGKEVANMVEGYPGAGDNSSRITVYDDNHVALTTKFLDRPTNSGGYRSAFSFDNDTTYFNAPDTSVNYSTTTTYSTGDAVLAGLTAGVGTIYTSLQNANTNHTPASSPTWWQVTSEFAQPHIADVLGVGPTTSIPGTGTACTGTSGVTRFYRFSFMLPTTNPGAPGDTHTYGTGFTNTGLLYQNNFWETLGNAAGNSPIRYATNGTGTQMGFFAATNQPGSNNKIYNFDLANIVYGQWYHYILEILWDIRSTVGYARVYRDYGDGAGYVVIPMARCPGSYVWNGVTYPGTKGKAPDTTPSTDPEYGKFYYASQAENSSGVPVPNSIIMQNYRNHVALSQYYTTYGIAYPDVTVEYKNHASAASLAAAQV